MTATAAVARAASASDAGRRRGGLRASEDGLEATTRVFELTGARATVNHVGLDIFWRNLRTRSLLDPLPEKKRGVGEYVLLGEIPEPSWCT